MTLGDALALSKSVPSDNDEMTLDQAMGNSASTDTFVPTIPEEHKVGFVKGMAMRFDAGIKNAAAGMYDMAALLASASPADWAFGGAISKKLKGVAKWERGLAEEQRRESASKNRGVQLAGEFVESAANLGYTLPVDILTGGQTKLALTGKVLPKVEAILSRIPDFALGQGWRSMIEGTQKEGNVIERTGAGIAGAGEGVAWGTVYGKAGSGVKAIPVMTSLGWGSSFYEALKENRLPTKDEQISGAAIGTAYGVAFALLPHLKKATKISPEKTALGKYEKLINEHANNGDFDKVKETVDTLMADEKIRPEVKEALGKVLEVPQIKAETPISGTITPELEPLAVEARKYKSAEEFVKEFSIGIKHGRYWHITDNPNFTIKPELGPHDMSSLGGGRFTPGKFMVTSDLPYWAEEYTGSRKYVAEIDMSGISPKEFYQVNRGMGNEFYVDNPAKAKVIKVIPIEQALKEFEQYQKVLGDNINSNKQLTDFYTQATAPKEGGEIYHGTGKPIEKLSDLNYTTQNYYGQGFYTTDNLSIAEGYSKKGGKTPTIYKVTPNENVKLFDMESKLTPEIKAKITDALGDYSDALKTSKNLREVFDEVRDTATGDMLPADEIQGIYDSVRANFEDMGYGGYEHVGGLKTGKSPHKVRIYWNPKSDVKLSLTGEGKVAVPGEGETKVRGLALGVEEKAVKNKLVKNFGELGDLPTYAVDNMAEQSRKAVELLNKDYDLAKKIAMGEKLPPNDILPESVFIAVENRATIEGDIATIRSLGVSSELVKEATMMGKRLRVLAERDPESPVTAIKEIIKIRQESAQKRLKTKDVKKLVEKDVSDIKKEIKKTATTKEDWATFIKSLEC
jgi:hypothetical protein